MNDEPRPRAWHGALALVVGAGGAQVAGMLVALVAALVVTIARGDVAGAMSPELVTSLAVIGPAVVTIGAWMVLASLAMPLLARVPVRSALGLRGAPVAAFFAAPVGILALGPTSDAMRRLMQHIAPDLTLGMLDQLESIARGAPLWAMVPLLALVPGVSEELLFRGAFQRSIARRALAIPMSALFFAAVHVDPHHVVAVVPLGFYLAWLGDRTDSVLVPITAHVANNATAVVATTVWGSSGDEALDWRLLVGGWIVAAMAIAVVWWSTRKRPVPAPQPVAF